MTYKKPRSFLNILIDDGQYPMTIARASLPIKILKAILFSLYRSAGRWVFRIRCLNIVTNYTQTDEPEF